MKQIILAAGKGSRLIMEQTNKCMVEVLGKPLIEYNLCLSNSINPDEIIIVIGHNANYIKEYVGNSYNSIPVRYVLQKHQLGIAHAIKLCKPYLTSSFFMCLGDELLVLPQIAEMKIIFECNSADCVCGMVIDSPENIKKAYTMNFDENYRILQLVEKPEKIFNHFKGTGYCLFSPSMLSTLDSLVKNEKRNEFEMGDWIQASISKGYRCFGCICGEKDFNINTVDDYKNAERYLGGN